MLDTDTKLLKPGLADREANLTNSALPLEIAGLSLDAAAPLIMVDVDEVLAMFMRGFENFVVKSGYEMRITRFALFQSVFPVGRSEPISMDTGKALFELFFREAAETMDAAPGAAEALRRLSANASVIVLSNAPDYAREGRRRWLDRRGFPYPMVLNNGPKGPAAAALAGMTTGPAAFIDDILTHLESVAEAAPTIRRFQMIADTRLRPFAHSAIDRHPRHDDWAEMEPALARGLGL